MKHLFLLLVVFWLPLSAQAGSKASIRIFNEARHEHTAHGFSLTAHEFRSGSSEVAALGLTFSIIESDIPLEHSNRNTIYPVYAFVNFSLNYAITPFFEGGLDLGDALFDKVPDNNTMDIDIYVAAGLNITLYKTAGLSIYHKTYNLLFNEIDDPTLQDVTLDVTGVSLYYYF
ncbi:MAG: hypothetical protein OEZ38_15005 [Gammaproteobacteria bacterium]|nr:hypothetical protein [Gammaproteobacteria bacterium]